MIIKKLSFREILKNKINNKVFHTLWNMFVLGDQIYLIEKNYGNKKYLIGHFSLKIDNSTCKITKLYILTEFQNYKNIKEFMEDITAIMKNNVNNITLHVDIKQKYVIDMCRELNFAKSDFVENYFGKNKHAYLMIKRI